MLSLQGWAVLCQAVVAEHTQQLLLYLIATLTTVY